MIDASPSLYKGRHGLIGVGSEDEVVSDSTLHLFRVTPAPDTQLPHWLTGMPFETQADRVAIRAAAQAYLNQIATALKARLHEHPGGIRPMLFLHGAHCAMTSWLFATFGAYGQFNGHISKHICSLLQTGDPCV